jgi:membrane-associated phospholipid phosphatase
VGLLLLTTLPSPARAGALDGPVGAVRVFFEDAWYVASSPARMNWSSAAWTAGIVGAGVLIYANDQEIYDAFQRSREDELYRAALWLGDRWEPVGNMGNTNIYYMGALAVGLATHFDPLERVPAEILQSHFTAGAARNIGKVMAGRRRPFEHMGARTFDPPHGTSLPSGHASVVFELAAIAAHETRDTPFSIPVSTVAHFAAASVSMQRIDSGNHWPSDVYVGAVSGALVSRTLLARRDARRADDDGVAAREESGVRVRWMPTFSRGQGLGARVNVSF